VEEWAIIYYAKDGIFSPLLCLTNPALAIGKAWQEAVYM
jgi:hypothetical protein